MKGYKLIFFTAVILFSVGLCAQSEKTRLIILADMGNEPDEEQQMSHMLLYANEFDLECLIAVSGKYLHAQHRLPERRSLYPQLFHKIITGYEKVYDNLKIHASGYPEPDYLRSIVTTGHVNYGIDAAVKGQGNKGSELIIKSFEANDPRPIYIVINAGSNTLAQALIDYKTNHSKEDLKELLRKLWVFENGAQDNSGAWICSQFPEINWMRSNYQTYAYGGPAWTWGNKDNDHKGPYTWKPYAYSAIGQHQWVLEHVKNHGGLGWVYPLRENHEGKLVFVEGGGTIPWMGLIHRGLTDFTKPYWGGWSGRFSKHNNKNIYSRHESVKKDELNYGDFFMYKEAIDTWTDIAGDTTYSNIYTPIWRWRQAYFDDFKGRMDWCVQEYDHANHHPIAAVNGDLEEKIHFIQLIPGEKIKINASDSNDPDGDNILYKWWIYTEASTYDGRINLINDHLPLLELTIPKDASGKEIHLILEINDENPIVSLRDYRRIVITVS